MKIALAQINTCMGAIEQNVKKIDGNLEKAKTLGADLTVFPELAIAGYPPKDLIERRGFVEKNQKALELLAKKHVDKRFIVGFIEKHGGPGNGQYNSAAYVERGKVKFVQRKSLLPTYDVFDESRYFDKGGGADVVDIMGSKVGITICEDMWAEHPMGERRLYRDNPTEELRRKKPDLFINISGSPYHLGKEGIRRQLIEKLVKKTKAPFVFVNLVGGNDELVFDGGSFVMDSKGELMHRSAVFAEELTLVDLDGGPFQIAPWPEAKEAWLGEALALGLRDYAKKCGFEKVLIGLSGGIDSALTALLAAEALGPENVSAVMMASPYTSTRSKEDAARVANALGIEFASIPIHECMKAYDHALKDVFKGLSQDATEENIQARIRGTILMALSNKFKKLVLSTGNKSELAVGYCTQYGDMAGGLAVISDLYKHEVYSLARHFNLKYQAIPEEVFTRAPSAELRPDQTDQDSLPPYGVLDAVLELYLEENMDEASIVAKGFESDVVRRVMRLVDQNEFKRRQAAPGLKVSAKAFGFGRRMPIARGMNED